MNADIIMNYHAEKTINSINFQQNKKAPAICKDLFNQRYSELKNTISRFEQSIWEVIVHGFNK